MWKKPLFAAMAFFAVAVAAAPLSAADRSSPIFGSAKVMTLSKADASKVAGKGNSTAAYYGYMGELLCSRSRPLRFYRELLQLLRGLFRFHLLLLRGRVCRRRVGLLLLRVSQ